MYLTIELLSPSSSVSTPKASIQDKFDYWKKKESEGNYIMVNYYQMLFFGSKFVFCVTEINFLLPNFAQSVA